MATASEALDEVISSIDRLRTTLGRRTTKQVTMSEEKTIIRATCLAWFNNHRPLLLGLTGATLFQSVDKIFQDLLESAERATFRTRYKDALKILKSDVVRLRSQAILLSNDTLLSNGAVPKPDFSKLISDSGMLQILNRRWDETLRCIDAKAFLAAIVMMGALLEALLLARINRMPDKSPLFKSHCAPKDKSGKPKPLQEWTLNAYIDVSHDLGWIRKSARDVGVVLRDYRNFIHPEKEFTHGITLEENDARIFWAIFTQLAEQIINS
jgi:hypothetical protein